MGVASTFLAAKTLALTLLNLTARMAEPPASRASLSSSATPSSEWNAVLDKSIAVFRNLSGSGPVGASQAYSVIYPGTLWCGQGSRAHSFDELGVFAGPDRCCRDHDHCPDSIGAHGTGHGLRNDRLIATQLCACDHKLLQCLRRDGSVIAREVGRLYFDFLDPVCFTYDYPVRDCKRRDKSGGHGRCVEYEYDTSRPPQWHFEDFPYHYGSRRVDHEVDIASEAAASLAGQERPDAAANGEDAELWNALLMNRHVRFGTKFGRDLLEPDDDVGDEDPGAARVAVDSGWGAVIGDQVFPGAD